MRQYLCIDQKSFYATVECVARGLDPMTTNLVVADPERSDKTICLAVSPSMKQLGVRNLHLIRGDVFKFVKACHVQYDFIYADPPYDLELLPTLPDLIFEQGILKEEGYFVLEHSKLNDFSNHPHFVEQRSYGSVHFSFFQ